MRAPIRDFVQRMSKVLPIEEPVYEFGSFMVEGQENIADLRPFFKGLEYVGADMREGNGVDVILDLHKINLPSQNVGTVVLVDTLEHVEYPRKAIEEVYRILKPGGVLIMSSVMNFHIHSYPNDYFRFTPEAFGSLLKDFETRHIDYLGIEDHPHTVVAVAVKGEVEDFQKIVDESNFWRNRWESSFMDNTVYKWMPPMLLRLWRLRKRRY